jgi:hypothetical protein
MSFALTIHGSPSFPFYTAGLLEVQCEINEMDLLVGYSSCQKMFQIKF